MNRFCLEKRVERHQVNFSVRGVTLRERDFVAELREEVNHLGDVGEMAQLAGALRLSVLMRDSSVLIWIHDWRGSAMHIKAKRSSLNNIMQERPNSGKASGC